MVIGIVVFEKADRFDLGMIPMGGQGNYPADEYRCRRRLMSVDENA